MGALELTTALAEAPEGVKRKLNQVAVGLAKLDYEDFVQKDYFKNGHVYVDEGKDTYKALNLPSKGFFSCYGLCNPKMWSKSSEAKKKGITGNMKGDGFQLGGTFIIDKAGNVIFSHVQSSYTDHPDPQKIISTVEAYNTS